MIVVEGSIEISEVFGLSFIHTFSDSNNNSKNQWKEIGPQMSLLEFIIRMYGQTSNISTDAVNIHKWRNSTSASRMSTIFSSILSFHLQNQMNLSWYALCYSFFKIVPRFLRRSLLLSIQIDVKAFVRNYKILPMAGKCFCCSFFFCNACFYFRARNNVNLLHLLVLPSHT